MEDEHLARRASDGDRKALELLASRHQRQIWSWALIAQGRAEAADDTTQEVLLRLVRSIGTFDPERSFLPWLRTLVRNVVTDERRQRSRPRPLPEPTDLPDPEARLDARRGIARANQAFAALTPRQREAYLLCEVEGRSAADAAEAMAVAPATVRVLLHQARRAIRTRILEEGP